MVDLTPKYSPKNRWVLIMIPSLYRSWFGWPMHHFQTHTHSWPTHTVEIPSPRNRTSGWRLCFTKRVTTSTTSCSRWGDMGLLRSIQTRGKMERSWKICRFHHVIYVIWHIYRCFFPESRNVRDRMGIEQTMMDVLGLSRMRFHLISQFFFEHDPEVSLLNR